MSCKDDIAIPIPIATSELKSEEEQPIEEEFVCWLPRNPEFIGGIKEMSKYISERLKIDLSESKPLGKIFVQFYVSENGSVEDIGIIKGGEQCPILRQNLIKVFQDMPKWKPSEDNGKALKMRMIIPITVELD